MDDVALHVCAGFQLDLAGPDGAADLALDLDDLGFDFAGDLAGSADRDIGGGNVAIDDAVNLKRAFGDHGAVDLHVGADDGSGTGSGLRRCATDGVLGRRHFRRFDRGVIRGSAILCEHVGLLSGTYWGHTVYHCTTLHSEGDRRYCVRSNPYARQDRQFLLYHLWRR